MMNARLGASRSLCLALPVLLLGFGCTRDLLPEGDFAKTDGPGQTDAQAGQDAPDADVATDVPSPSDGGADAADAVAPVDTKVAVDGGGCKVDCNDNNECTLDSCNAIKPKGEGCEHNPVPEEGKLCADNAKCQQGKCQQGSCVASAGGPPTCDDGNPCTQDSCTPGSGCSHQKLDKTPCGDGNPCTKDDHCTNGNCGGVPDPACNSGNCPPGAYFEAWFGQDDKPDELVRAIPQGDGYLLFGTRSSAPASGEDGWVIQVNKDGGVVGQANWGTGGEERFAGALAGPGAWVAVGMTQSLADATPRGWFVSGTGLNKQVDVAYVPYAANGGKLLGIEMGNGNSTLAVGIATFIDGTPTQAWFLRLDPAGKVLNDNNFGGADADLAYGVSPKFNGGGYAVVGHSRVGAGNYQAFLTLLDSSGDVTSTEQWGGPGDDRLDVLMPSPQGFVAAGTFDTQKDKGLQGWLVGVDQNGKQLWQRFFGDNQDQELFAIVPIQGAEGFALAGRSGKDGWVLRVDGSKNFFWQSTLPAPVSRSALGLISVPGGGVVVLGKGVQSAGKQSNGFIKRLDHWGHPDCKIAGVCATKNLNDCNDMNPCTIDTCEGGGCSSGKQAADGVACGPDKQCKGGQCI